MTTYTHLITLRPLDKFFFGDENTFNTVEDNSVNYLASSRYFPQQTTLLGMLRLELLLQNGLLADITDTITDPTSATQLIGDKGFRLHEATKSLSAKQDWGAIKDISPVFLQNGNEKYFVAPNDYCLSLQIKKPARIALGLGQSPAELALVYPCYDAKKHHKTLLISDQFAKKELDCVFTQRQQIGVKKKSAEDGYYKQTHYTLAKGFVFAFYANIALPESKKLDNSIVSIGGERSAFKMEITPLGNQQDCFTTWNTPQMPKSSLSKIYLLTDAFVPNSIDSCCSFAYCTTLSFRQIETSLGETKNFWDMNNKVDRHKNRNQKAVKSQLYNFFARGSVFYAHSDKLTDLQTAFNLPALQQVGYNHFITIQNQ